MRNVAVLHESDRARASEYLLLANLLRAPPSTALFADIARIKGDASPLGLAHLDLGEAAGRGSHKDAGNEFFNLFIGVGRGEIVPYASFYLTGFLHERPLARVREDLARLGIERQPNVFEPEDHIAALFEVMALLIGDEFETPAGSADKFFGRHIAPWGRRLMADITVTPSARFYKAVARSGLVFLEIETEAMRLPE